MKKLIFWTSTGLIFTFWPISFYLANTQTWQVFTVAAIVLIADWFLYLKEYQYHYFLYLILPLIHPVYLVFPIIFLFLNFKNFSKPFTLVSYLLILIVISLFSYKTFYVYSIFTPDPLAKDTLIKKISLIPNRNLARIYENKSTVFLEKYKANIFIYLDPNNYFFSLHPREIGDNQNLNKYSFLTIIPFLIGLFFIVENIHKKWILNTTIATFLTISFINNPDRYDLIVFMPISLICFHGLRKLSRVSNIYFWLFSIAFIPISIIELIRVIVFK